MYRAVALAALRANVDESDAVAVGEIARQSRITFDGPRLLLNDDDVSTAVFTPDVSAVASIIASNPLVRARLVELQRDIGQQGSMVTEGRDQGTVVFPAAAHKFFITASLESRAFRRQRELAASGVSQPIEVVTDELHLRDHRDETRTHAPMIPAADAVLIDTSDLTIAQVVNSLVRRVRGKT